MTTPDSFITVREAAQRLGLTTAAVYARIDAGKMAEHKAYGKCIVAVADVEQWETERKATADAR